MEDSNSASTQRRIAAWRSRIAATLAGSRRRKVATAVALMLTSLAVFDPTGFDGTKNATGTGSPNMSEDEFEQIEAMLAELERTPDLNEVRTTAEDSATANVGASQSQPPSSGTLLIPNSADDSESDPAAAPNYDSFASSSVPDLRSADSLSAGVPAAARGVSYTGSPSSTGDQAPRIRLTGTIDPL